MAKKNSGHRISIRSVKKNPPDLSKLGRALIALAMAQAEAEAQTQEGKADKSTDKSQPASKDAS